jgi:CubicO group peptidase (beta-lactamase class C family)
LPDDSVQLFYFRLKFPMRLAPLLLAAILASVSASAGIWAPSRDELEAAWRYSLCHQGYSLLVIQRGHTLLERYADGDGPNFRHKIYSGTKGLWCVAALAAQADGLLSLDEPVAATIPEWRRQPGRERITIRQLLNFTAGLAPGFHLHSNDVPDRDSYALALPLVAMPGDAFIYGPGQIQVFCEVLRRKLMAKGDETPWHYLVRRVLRPLGLVAVPHKVDAMGNPLLATGVQLTAREWARFGQLLLAGGRGVLPSGALGQCLCGTDRNPAFGMGFWVNSQAPGGRTVNVEDNLAPKWSRVDWTAACLCREAPRDLFVSLGSMGQRLYVVPSLGLVVVRLSGDSKYSDAEFLRLLMASQ